MPHSNTQAQTHRANERARGDQNNLNKSHRLYQLSRHGFQNPPSPFLSLSRGGCREGAYGCVCAFAMMTLTQCSNVTKSSAQSHEISLSLSLAFICYGVFLVCIGLLYSYRYLSVHMEIVAVCGKHCSLFTVYCVRCVCCYCQAGKFSRFFCFCHDLYCGFFAKRITHIPCLPVCVFVSKKRFSLRIQWCMLCFW